MSLPDVAQGDPHVAAHNAERHAIADLDLKKIAVPDADGWPMYAYGSSFTVLSSPTFTPGQHYLSQVAAKINAGGVASYGQGGRRIFDAALGAISGTAFPGVTDPEAGAMWPTSRNGLVVIDSLTNDITHGPTSGNNPTAMSSNNRYRDCVGSALRALMALVSAGSRIEESAWVMPTDTWGASGGAYWSANASYVTTTAGVKISYSVTPPQKGPLAGKVFILVYKVDPLDFTTADVTIAIDGGTAVATPIGQWEKYSGNAGTSVSYCPHVITVNVPVDGAAHTVTMTHAGATGQILVMDAVLVPSETPSAIAVLEAPAPVAKAGWWDASQVAQWKANAAIINPVVKSVVAEFPNAFWVPTTVTPNGLYSADGIHPNDRGMAQRASDLQLAITSNLRARLASRVLEDKADSNFAIL